MDKSGHIMHQGDLKPLIAAGDGPMESFDDIPLSSLYKKRKKEYKQSALFLPDLSSTEHRIRPP